MSKIVNVEVPDIGDFTDVDIIEVLVSAGAPYLGCGNLPVAKAHVNV